MKGYTQINVIFANKLYRRPANQYKSHSSMTTCNKVHDTNLMLLVFLDLKKVGNLSFITFGHIKQLTPILKILHSNALSLSKLDKSSIFY